MKIAEIFLKLDIGLYCAIAVDFFSRGTGEKPRAEYVTCTSVPLAFRMDEVEALLSLKWNNHQVSLVQLLRECRKQVRQAYV